ncbi:MurNAc alpha-1-phosphate uridylyltransferase [Roseibium hamelinense]|uniref:MurNAc alpha-1-phosphate uridylyltransferase n=1 Tax=Roseibium hamelinense TaxID=150831 RepID=A0A562T0V3_9HYPH|nr:nucleotidyltransferase family protein [Roseibium hamelinense]MTI44565.1 nucleotidyltransferase family protein [Roseibium hamelinense]TWI87191.1 MurNAc alpha-1-phosphate uridylyltransferase [Roseibium hamelinense]
MSKQFRPQSAMILAAGRGKRMRPITATTPKPLIEVNGKSLIDHGLDRLVHAGVKRCVVNVHYLADLVEVHVRRRADMDIMISDERHMLLDTGGGIKKALPMLGDEPFFQLNADTAYWIEGVKPNLEHMIDTWDESRMDALLLVAETVRAVGYGGRGDFQMARDGSLIRRPERGVTPFAYAGAAILHPRLFERAPEGAFSMNMLFDRAIEQERLFGVQMEGVWLHIGTPDAILAAEYAVRESAA